MGDDEFYFEQGKTPLRTDNATVYFPELHISPMWKLNPSADIDGPSTMTGDIHWYMDGSSVVPLNDLKMCLEHLVDWSPLTSEL